MIFRDERIRINKYLASCGVCSRREADVLLLTGRVKVNGEVPASGVKVSSTDLVTLDGMAVRPLETRLFVAYHKPAGTTCTTRDAHAARTVYDDVQVFVNEKPVRLSYAGRLDKESEGLLLFTNDGDVIERITRGKFHQEKEYLVAVTCSKADTEPLSEKIAHLEDGVFLPDLNRTTLPCVVEEVKGEEAEEFLQEQPAGAFVLRFILTQGLNRQIRRMCAAVGLKVLRLKRIRVMHIALGDLPPGAWRYMTDEEQEELLCLTNIKP